MTGSPENRGDGDLSGRLDDGRPDPLEQLLRPPAEFLAAPPGSFDAIRRRAARRRNARALVGGGAAVAVLAGALYLVGSLTGGGGDEVVGPPASSSTTGSATASPSPSATPSATTPSTGSVPTQRPTTGSTGTGTATTPTGAPAGPTVTPSTQGGTTPMCATSQLTASLGGGDAGAGNLYRYLVLTNHSATACHVNGYPGLSLLDSTGKQIGAPATRDERPHQQVVLKPGGSASDTIHTVNQQGTCLPQSAKLRIYPPGNTASLDFPGQITNCDNQFSVTPFTEGATGNPSS